MSTFDSTVDSTVDRYDAVVLAGGRATRLGGVPKPTVVVDGAPLLDHALTATARAERTVVVGPEPTLLPTGTARAAGHRQDDRDVTYAREDPPFGGPVAGLDAGLRALERARVSSDPDPDPGGAAVPSWVLVLAVDVPRAARAVPRLLAAVDAPGPEGGGSDGAYLVRAGRAQWLVGLYRHDSLRRALDGLVDEGTNGTPVRRLVARLSCVEVPDDDDASLDVDTWDDVGRLTVGGHDDVTGTTTARPPDPAGGNA